MPQPLGECEQDFMESRTAREPPRKETLPSAPDRVDGGRRIVQAVEASGSGILTLPILKVLRSKLNFNFIMLQHLTVINVLVHL